MRPGAEAQQLRRVGIGESRRRRTCRGRATRRPDGWRPPVDNTTMAPAGNCVLGDVGGLDDGAGDGPDARFVADRFRGGTRRELRRFAHARRLLWMAQQRQQRATELAGRGVVPTDDQVGHHRDELVVRQPLAVLLGRQQRSDRDPRRGRRAGRRRDRARSRASRRLLSVAAAICSSSMNTKVGLSASAQSAKTGRRVREPRADRHMTRIGIRPNSGDEIAAAVHLDRRHRFGDEHRCVRPQRLDGARRERTRHEHPKTVVRGAFVGEHQAAVPVPQRSVVDPHEVEERETDARQPAIASEPVDVLVAEDDRRSGHVVDAGRPFGCVLPQRRVHVVAEHRRHVEHGRPPFQMSVRPPSTASVWPVM